MYYSYVEIEYVATSFSPARTDLALKLLSTKKEFLSTISLSCIDKKKETKMTPPYALALENVAMDVGPISTHGQRKIDARHYN